MNASLATCLLWSSFLGLSFISCNAVGMNDAREFGALGDSDGAEFLFELISSASKNDNIIMGLVAGKRKKFFMNITNLANMCQIKYAWVFLSMPKQCKTRGNHFTATKKLTLFCFMLVYILILSHYNYSTLHSNINFKQDGKK